MACSTLLRSGCAYVLTLSLAAATVPPIATAASVFGTIQVSGTASVASGANDWSRLRSTRPLVSGDRLKTGEDGLLLADLGRNGVIGLFDNAEIAVEDVAGEPVVRIVRGTVAFQLSKGSNVEFRVEDAGIASHAADTKGYIEYDTNGRPVIVVEEGSVVADVAGVGHELTRGERLVLRADADTGRGQFAADDAGGTVGATKAGPVAAPAVDDGGDIAGAAKAGPVAAPAADSGSSSRRLGKAGWTAIAIVAVGVVAGGIGAGVGLSGGGGGGAGNYYSPGG